MYIGKNLRVQNLHEIGKNLKHVTPHSKWSPLSNCTKPNDEIQTDFGGPTINEKGLEQNLATRVDRYSKYPTVEIVNNASSTNVIKCLITYI